MVTANMAAVGVDLLLHPSNTDTTDFVISRYTISAIDAASVLPGTGAVTGSFRELVVPNNVNGNNGGSVDVFVFQNTTQLFSFESLDGAAGGSTLLEADGTFNVSGLTLAPGDTISFAVGSNGNFGADETALTAQISGEMVPEPGVAGLLGLGGALCLFRRRR